MEKCHCCLFQWFIIYFTVAHKSKMCSTSIMSGSTLIFRVITPVSEVLATFFFICTPIRPTTIYLVPRIHLGHHIGKNCNYDSISKGISDLVYRTNYVTAKIGFCNSLITSHMFDTYCTSFYGCPLWNIKTCYINRFYVNWRKCVRRIGGVPWITHGAILKHLMREQGQSIQTQLFSRFLSFYYDVVRSDNKCVTCVVYFVQDQIQM
jgi:hypothetical protein